METTAFQAQPDRTFAGAAVEVGGFLAAISVVSGVIHVEAAVIHFPHLFVYGAMFTLTAVLQFGWAAWVARSLSRYVLWSGVLLSAGLVAVWTLSRTVGMPVGPEAWSPEPIGLLDVAATVDELVIVIAGLSVLMRQGPFTLSVPMQIVLINVALLTGTAALVGGHGH